jgi:hypothetical protein
MNRPGADEMAAIINDLNDSPSKHAISPGLK